MSSPAPGRYHALDALRASMMLLGLVLHSAVNYVSRPVPVWPYQDPANSGFFDVLMVGIHVFRMPVFFVMAGFFSALLFQRGVWRLVRNRLERIAAPFAVAWLILSPIVLGGSWFVLNLRYEDPAAHLASLPRPAGTDPSGLWQDNTFHLWFLYLLLYLNAGGLLLALAARRLPAGLRRSALDLFERVVRSPLRLLPLALLSVATTWPMPKGAIDTSIRFLPDWKVLLAYAPFFLFGWLLHERRDLLAGFERFAGTQVVLATLLVPVHLVALGRVHAALPGGDEPARIVALVSLGFSTWLFTFGLTGLCLRWLSGHQPWVRYLSDASYWLYLVHLPFTVVLPVLFLNAPLPALLKFLGVLSLTTLIGLLSYHYLVRASFIGRFLNGKRYPRRWPSRRDEVAVSD